MSLAPPRNTAGTRPSCDIQQQLPTVSPAYLPAPPGEVLLRHGEEQVVLFSDVGCVQFGKPELLPVSLVMNLSCVGPLSKRSKLEHGGHQIDKTRAFLGGRFASRSFPAQVSLQEFLQRHCVVVFRIARTVDDSCDGEGRLMRAEELTAVFLRLQSSGCHNINLVITQGTSGRTQGKLVPKMVKPQVSKMSWRMADWQDKAPE